MEHRGFDHAFTAIDELGGFPDAVTLNDTKLQDFAMLCIGDNGEEVVDTLVDLQFGYVAVVVEETKSILEITAIGRTIRKRNGCSYLFLK